ncbi:DUF4136 domain-containing protein [Robiginitalea sediminis]|uniref:DUF4136 domain-containing protein n=1 Tax=Robiginitalea sediminis TaxID=1982593 RepID=UPI000B4B93BF|nr:DUF4136 domain-containing protein [Robiginitalea sediminis]
MKALRFTILVFLSLQLAGCAAVRVRYDYEPRADWSGFKTYGFYPEMQTGLNDLDSRRLLDALETVLREKGYRQAEEPDFLIDVVAETYQEPSRSNVGVGLGGTGRNVGGGISVGIPVSSSGLKQQITFNIIDTTSDGLIWQAVTTDTFREGADPLQKEARFLQIATKAMSGFPPE